MLQRLRDLLPGVPLRIVAPVVAILILAEVVHAYHDELPAVLKGFHGHMDLVELVGGTNKGVLPGFHKKLVGFDLVAQTETRRGSHADIVALAGGEEAVLLRVFQLPLHLDVGSQRVLGGAVVVDGENLVLEVKHLPRSGLCRLVYVELLCCLFLAHFAIPQKIIMMPTRTPTSHPMCVK